MFINDVSLKNYILGDSSSSIGIVQLKDALTKKQMGKFAFHHDNPGVKPQRELKNSHEKS